ncbi:MAG: hypothetical protein IPO25_22825 [Saprospiraceae bacterium]|nr:hypothetical protein [Saprospiraceae bacterium]
MDELWEIQPRPTILRLDVSLKDIDGPLNNNPYDNAGGKPESLPMILNKNGTGAPGDGVDTTDSDESRSKP